MRKTVNIILIIGILLLQPKLWRGNGSVTEVLQLKNSISKQQTELKQLQQRNAQLLAKVQYIKINPEAIEELARFKLGMIKKRETYYQVVMPVE